MSAAVGDTIKATRNTAGITAGNLLEVVEIVPPFFVKAVAVDGVEHLMLAGDYVIDTDDDDDANGTEPACCEPGDNHSGDIVECWYGASAPIYRCGYHLQRVGSSPVQS